MNRNTDYVDTAEKLYPAKLAAIACLEKVPFVLVHAAFLKVFSELRIANTVTFNTKEVTDRLLTSIKEDPTHTIESKCLSKLKHLLASESLFFWHVVTEFHGDCVFSVDAKKNSTLTFLEPQGVPPPHTVDPTSPPTSPHGSGESILGRVGEILLDLQEGTHADNQQVDVEQVVQAPTPPLVTIDMLQATIQHLTQLRGYEHDEMCRAKATAEFWRSHSIDLERECLARHQCHYYSTASHANADCRTHVRCPNDRCRCCPFHHIGERSGNLKGTFNYALFKGEGVGYDWEPPVPPPPCYRMASPPPAPTPLRPETWDEPVKREDERGVPRSQSHFSMEVGEQSERQFKIPKKPKRLRAR